MSTCKEADQEKEPTKKLEKTQNQKVEGRTKKGVINCDKCHK
jgi:hypothetical protein